MARQDHWRRGYWSLPDGLSDLLTLLAISTAGIPVAISKLVAENITVSDYRGAMRVFRIALLILTLTGLVISLLLFFTADTIVRIAKIDPRSVYAIMAIAPAIFFVTVMSALRGFFQGQQYMLPTAASQMIEQVGRAVVSLLLAVALLPGGWNMPLPALLSAQ